jgi:hypothetical protein
VKVKGFFIVLLVPAVLLAACISSPVPKSEPESVSESGPAPAAPQLEFNPVYDKYEGRLILDGATKYEVQKGDTLSNITRAQYGQANGLYFPLIMLASTDIVSDPDLIEPGMLLSVPDLQRNLDDINARQVLKDFLREIAGVYERKGTYDATRRGLLELSDSL